MLYIVSSGRDDHFLLYSTLYCVLHHLVVLPGCLATLLFTSELLDEQDKLMLMTLSILPTHVVPGLVMTHL